MSKLQIFLNKKVFNRPIYLDQYDRKLPIEFEVLNADGTPYQFQEGDYPRLDIVIGETVVVINTINDFSINANIVTWISKREVTVNKGKGTMSFYICNSITDKRVGSFKREIIVESATVEDGTVSSELTVTAIEILAEKTSEANTALAELNTAIGNADLGAYTKKTEFNTAISDIENNVNTSMESVSTELEAKRDKTTKIKSSDLDTSADANKIKQINLSEEVKQMMAGNTPINAVPENGSITTGKMANGAITSIKLAGNTGRILTRNCINITLGTTITITMLKGHNLFFDNNNFKIAIQGPITIANAQETSYCLYLNLETSLLECKKIVDVNVANIKIAMLYNNISTPFAILYGNDEAIKVYNEDMQIFDKVNYYLKGTISPARKINILIDKTAKTLDVAFAVGNTTVFANGISYSNITSKEVLTYTVNTLPFNLLYNIKTNKLFFKYGDTSIAENMGSNVIFLCSFFTDGTILDIASGSMHNILINGVDYFPIGSVDNTIVNPSSPLWNNQEYVFGLDKTIANIPLEQVGNRVVFGMVSTVCSPNSRWNKVNRGQGWVDAYDNGKGGHGFEVFSKDFSYRYTVLLDYREADDLPVASVQLFQRNNSPAEKVFGWIRVGCDDYSKSTYGYVGGWMFRDSLAKAGCPVMFEKRPLPTKLPTNHDEIAPLDSRPILAADLNGVMRIWDYDTKRWLKIITEKELEQKEMIINNNIGVENAFYILPNGIKNDAIVLNRKPYKVKRIASYTLNGTENWSIANSGDNAIRFGCTGLTMEAYNLDYANSNINMLSDKGVCRWTGVAELNTDENIVIMGRSVNGGFFVVIDKALATDVASLKTYLASNNIKIYYQLATEVTTEIS